MMVSIAGLPQGEGGLAAAVVELDALADAVGAAAEDHDPLLAGLDGRVSSSDAGAAMAILVGRRSRSDRRALRRWSSNTACRPRTRRRRYRRACRRHRCRVLLRMRRTSMSLGVPQVSELAVGEAVLLGLPEQIVATGGFEAGAGAQLDPPCRRFPGCCAGTRVDLGALVDLLDASCRP